MTCDLLYIVSCSPVSIDDILATVAHVVSHVGPVPAIGDRITIRVTRASAVQSDGGQELTRDVHRVVDLDRAVPLHLHSPVSTR